MGTFHEFRPKHINRYVQEFAGKQNTRDLGTLAQMRDTVAPGFSGGACSTGTWFPSPVSALARGRRSGLSSARASVSGVALLQLALLGEHCASFAYRSMP